MKKLLHILAVFMLSIMPFSSVLAQESGDGGNGTSNTIFIPMIAGDGSSPVEQLDEDGFVTVDGTIHSSIGATTEKGAISAAAADQLRPVSLILTLDESVNLDELQAVAGGQIIHRYEKVFNGVSLVTFQDRIDIISKLQGVTGVYLDKMQQLDTDSSVDFIRTGAIWNQLGGQKAAGEGVIVGILDSGIWPEHPSLSDPDPSGNPYPAPPTIPGANGFGPRGERSTCDFGNTAANAEDAPFTCNNKLIGAYNMIDTYKAVVGLLPTEFDSARDDNGHGTHTATTAAGNSHVQSTLLGVDRGEVTGVAPRAHVIAYRVCGDDGCFSSDSVAAVDQAIRDNVDVINFSISGGNAPYDDVVSLAFLEAYFQGVFVAASAGNSGPGADTVAHREPWVTTVAASTSDRHFLTKVVLRADNGDVLRLTGATVTAGISTPIPVVVSPDPQCNPMAPGTFNGEIVICDRGIFARVLKSFNASVAGAGGMILRNLVPQGLNTDNHFIPSIHLDGAEGDQLMAFMASHSGVVATFNGGRATQVPGDVMASFSSRGGTGQRLGISKPDVTAPGVQILAGHTPKPATPEGGLPGELFQAIQGTSMSSPHVAGAGALLKDLHPDWTPGQIKSALMMTAIQWNVVKEDGVTPADAFDYGSGRILMSRAGNPGLTMDESAINYFLNSDSLWNTNYPSFYHPSLPGKITVQRTVKNVTSNRSSWALKTKTDNKDWSISVPASFTVAPGGEFTFDIAIDASNVPLGAVRMGMITIDNADATLSFPVTFVRGEAPVIVSKVCEPAKFKMAGGSTSCTITMQNTTFEATSVEMIDNIPQILRAGNVSGAEVLDNGRALYFSGVLAPSQPPLVNAAIDPTASPAGYLPLGGFGGNAVVNASDESITNFNVPSFTYAGETWSQIGIVSNGYIVVGGGTGADVDYLNSNLPSGFEPNNVLAPFWTDLNPAASGRILVNVLTDGVNSWLIVEWESVPNFSDGQTNSFQVWIGIDGPEDISFVYGPDITAGDNALLTVGAENKFGNSGQAVYFNGAGTAPTPSYPNGDPGYEVDIFSTPGEAGVAHEVTFTMTAKYTGPWQNCVEVTSPSFDGTAVDCAAGKVR